jgi:hypothetical protein
MKKYVGKQKNSPFSSPKYPKISPNISLGKLCRNLRITEKDLLEHLTRREQTEIPASIFSNEKLSGFELITKYLIENCRLQISEAARLLKRDYQTIRTEYRNSKKKQPSRLAVPASKYFFPITALANRKFSVLEAIVTLMKDELGLKFIEIACELHRDPRNIFTAYQRARAKNKETQSNESSNPLNRSVAGLCRKLNITEKALLEQLKTREAQTQIPTSIFSNEKLSGLELISKYLIENCGLQFAEAGRILNRDSRTVWTSYQSASRKHIGRLSVPASKYFFPISILSDRKFSVLEAIVTLMKEQLGLTFSEIASELYRDQRNIWTVYNRAKTKCKK